MTEARRRAYLEAMGFDVWVRKPPPPLENRLVVGPGRGNTLLICATPELSASKLAADIARAVGGEPVWAWPDPEGRPASPDLEQAVRDGLFTRVMVFGEETRKRLMGAQEDEVVASSTVRSAADLEELAVRGEAKRRLWQLICGPA